jgi:hypothetical protein
MTYYLVEYDTGNRFGPASDELVKEWKTAISRGTDFFLYPYFGYHLKMTVEEAKDSPSCLL